MKIVAGKRDDILRDKAAYEADKAKSQAEYNKQMEAYRQAKNQVMSDIKSAVESELGNHASEVRIDAYDHWNVVEVKVDNGDDPHGPHALSWNWSVKLDRDGNIVKDSGSWSGLFAVTAEQIQDLRNTANILEILNNIDWKTLLNVKVPSYEDYITMRDPSTIKPERDYDAELEEADVEELIGDKNAAVFIGKALSNYYKGGSYASIRKETLTRFNVTVIPAYQLSRWMNNENVGYDAVITKDKFYRYVDTSEIVRR